MSHITTDRYGVSAADLNALSLEIQAGISANLHESYRININALRLSEDGDYSEFVEGYDNLAPLWGQIIKAAKFGLTTRIREREEYIRLGIYTISQVDVEDVIVDGVTTKKYTNRRGGDLLLHVVYTRSDRSLTYTKFWE